MILISDGKCKPKLFFRFRRWVNEEDVFRSLALCGATDEDWMKRKGKGCRGKHI